jgi:hypothetical protein
MDDTPGYEDEKRLTLHQLQVERNQLLRNVRNTRVKDIENAFVGEWSVKDVVCHVAIWEREVVKALEQIRAGKHPEILDFDESRLDEWNAATLAACRDWTLAQALEDLDRTRKELLAAVEGFSDEEAFRPGSVVAYLLEATSGHDREHWHEIAARLAGLPGARPDTSVSLPPVRAGRS